MEKRSLDQVVVDLGIHVGEDAAAVGVVQLVKRDLRGLRPPASGEPRRATIYGPGGDLLATVELEDDAEDGA